MAENKKEENQNLINSQKTEIDIWKEYLKNMLTENINQIKELFIISQYWFNKYKYIKSFSNKNGDKEKYNEILENLKDDNNKLFCQFTEKNINIEDLPKIFVLNKDIWKKIKIEKYELNTIASFGYFYNNLLFLKVLENIYCFFFIDSKNRIRQGYIQINQMIMKIEDNFIKDFQEKGIIDFIKIKIKDLGDEKLKNSKDNEYKIYILSSNYQKDNDNNKTENDFEIEIINKRRSKTLFPLSLKNINNDLEIYSFGTKIFKIKKSFKIDIEEKFLGARKLFKKLWEKIELDKKVETPMNNILRARPPKPKIPKKFYGLISNEFEERKSTPGIIGLQNIGATCYMNATLQCFSNIQNLRNNLLEKYEILEKNKNKYKLSFALAEVIKNLWENLDINYYAPQYFKDIISEMNPLFRGIAANDPKDLVLFK